MYKQSTREGDAVIPGPVNPFAPRHAPSCRSVPPARKAPRTCRHPEPRRRRPSSAVRTCSVCRRRASPPCCAPFPPSRIFYPTPSPSRCRSRSPLWSGWSTVRARRPGSPTGTSDDSCASPRPARTWTRTRSPPAICRYGKRHGVLSIVPVKLFNPDPSLLLLSQWRIGVVFLTEYIFKESKPKGLSLNFIF